MLNFHLYGFIISIAIIVGALLVEHKAKKYGISEQEYWSLFIWVLIFGIVGARLWHVATDFYLYQDSLLDIFKVWNGGLSIIGAIVGGIFALLAKTKQPITNNQVRKFLDLAAFGLPFAQAIGRLGNYFNHELYGSPTSLPWGIYEGNYHPLFAYEAIAMVSFGVLMWLLEIKNQKALSWRHAMEETKIGSGKYFLAYVLYYSTIRFFLDFLRIDKAMFFNTGLGVNQVVLLIVIVCASLYFGVKFMRYNLRKGNL